MKKLPAHPLSIVQLIITTLSTYHLIFPSSLALVILSSIGHLVIPPLFLKNPAYAGVAAVGFVLLTWFLFTAIISKSYILLKGGRMTPKDALRLAKQHYLRVLGSNIIFFAIGIFMLLIVYTLNIFFDLIHLHPMYLMASIAINITIFIYLYFAIPQIALEKSSILAGFEKSVHLVKNHWWRTFIVLAFIAAIILGFEALGILFTGKNRMVLFTGYHFALQVVFYPLIVAVTLTLLNDLKLRQNTQPLN